MKTQAKIGSDGLGVVIAGSCPTELDSVALRMYHVCLHGNVSAHGEFHRKTHCKWSYSAESQVMDLEFSDEEDLTPAPDQPARTVSRTPLSDAHRLARMQWAARTPPGETTTDQKLDRLLNDPAPETWHSFCCTLEEQLYAARDAATDEQSRAAKHIQELEIQLVAIGEFAVADWNDKVVGVVDTTVQEPIRYKDRLRCLFVEIPEERDRLRAENTRLREALEFYGNPEVYHAVRFLIDPPDGGWSSDFDEEHGHPDYQRAMPGKRARTALAGPIKPEAQTIEC